MHFSETLYKEITPLFEQLFGIDNKYSPGIRTSATNLKIEFATTAKTKPSQIKFLMGMKSNGNYFFDSLPSTLLEVSKLNKEEAHRYQKEVVNSKSGDAQECIEILSTFLNSLNRNKKDHMELINKFLED